MNKKDELRLFVEGLVEKELKENELGEAIEEGVLDWAKEKMGKMKGSKSKEGSTKQKAAFKYEPGSLSFGAFKELLTKKTGGTHGYLRGWAAKAHEKNHEGPRWLLDTTGAYSDGKYYSEILGPKQLSLTVPKDYGYGEFSHRDHEDIFGAQEEGWVEILTKDFSRQSTMVQVRLTPLGAYNYLKSYIPQEIWNKYWDSRQYDVRAAISRSRPRK